MFVQPVDYFLAIWFCIAHQQEFHDGRNGACHEFLMMGRDMRAMEPTELLFWGVMSLGVIAGYILASVPQLVGLGVVSALGLVIG